MEIGSMKRSHNLKDSAIHPLSVSPLSDRSFRQIAAAIAGILRTNNCGAGYAQKTPLNKAEAHAGELIEARRCGEWWIAGHRTVFANCEGLSIISPIVFTRKRAWQLYANTVTQSRCGACCGYFMPNRLHRDALLERG